MTQKCLIQLNDEAYHFAGQTLADLLVELESEGRGLAIALNQQVVPKSLWASTTLEAGQHVYIFESIAGG
ncbi:sulfur carrier protein ThiS [Marinomonas epiphytica]